MGRASSFKQHYESGYSSDSLTTSVGGSQRAPSVQSREDEMKKWVVGTLIIGALLFALSQHFQASLMIFCHRSFQSSVTSPSRIVEDSDPFESRLRRHGHSGRASPAAPSVAGDGHALPTVLEGEADRAVAAGLALLRRPLHLQVEHTAFRGGSSGQLGHPARRGFEANAGMFLVSSHCVQETL